jgi:hypothetical protein
MILICGFAVTPAIANPPHQRGQHADTVRRDTEQIRLGHHPGLNRADIRRHTGIGQSFGDDANQLRVWYSNFFGHLD